MNMLPLRSCVLALHLILAAATFAPKDAHSAQIEVRPLRTGDDLVSIVGPIQLGDADRFAHVIAERRTVIVNFDSPGGALFDALRIGQMIRARGYDTAVLGQSTCASACALAWLGGTRRYFDSTARVGFHAAYSRNDGAVSSVGNAMVGAYLQQLSLSMSAIVYIVERRPDEMNWLTLQTAQRIGLQVASIGSPVARPAAPTVQPYAPPSSSTITLEQTAADFVLRLNTVYSDDNRVAMAFLRRAYAPNVEFYGGQTTAERIILLKQQFVDRWPQRVYTVNRDTLTAQCNHTSRRCTVNGVLDWDARSQARNAQSVGSASFQLVLAMQETGRDPIIVSETGRVLSRSAAPLREGSE